MYKKYFIEGKQLGELKSLAEEGEIGGIENLLARIENVQYVRNNFDADTDEETEKVGPPYKWGRLGLAA